MRWQWVRFGAGLIRRLFGDTTPDRWLQLEVEDPWLDLGGEG